MRESTAHWWYNSTEDLKWWIEVSTNDGSMIGPAEGITRRLIHCWESDVNKTYSSLIFLFFYLPLHLCFVGIISMLTIFFTAGHSPINELYFRHEIDERSLEMRRTIKAAAAAAAAAAACSGIATCFFAGNTFDWCYAGAYNPERLSRDAAAAIANNRRKKNTNRHPIRSDKCSRMIHRPRDHRPKLFRSIRPSMACVYCSCSRIPQTLYWVLVLRSLLARRYASAGLCDSDVSVCLSVCLSVRPSVCPSHAGIVPSRAKEGSWNVHRLIAPWLVSGKVWLVEKFARGHPQKGAKWGGFGFFRRFSTNMSSYLENGAFFTQSYYRTVIVNHMQAIEWCHFRWPSVTPDPDFKVMVVLKGEYLQSDAFYRHSYYIGR